MIHGEFQVLDARAGFLDEARRNVHSQFGEDGLIESLFQRVGETSRWCFEVGAADGLFYSNTAVLRAKGWSAVLIESDSSRFEALKALRTDDVRIVPKAIDEWFTVEHAIDHVGAPRNMDLGVIDIDGQDFWAFHDMKFRPRVMLVEFARVDRPVIPPRGGHANEGQAGLLHIEALARVKGYVPLCATHVNLLMVREDVWKQFD